MTPDAPARHPALIKPCPFCGGRDISFVVRNPSYGECADCLTEGPSADSPTKAMAAWDRRASDEIPTFLRRAGETDHG